MNTIVVRQLESCNLCFTGKKVHELQLKVILGFPYKYSYKHLNQFYLISVIPWVSYGGCSLKKKKKIQTIHSIEFFVIKQLLSSQFIQLESATVVQNEWKQK
jgi:hypothetical protein